jgi:hypothetical protein
MYGFVIFWVVTPHSQVGGYQCSGETCCLKTVDNHRALSLHNVRPRRHNSNAFHYDHKCFIQRFLERTKELLQSGRTCMRLVIGLLAEHCHLKVQLFKLVLRANPTCSRCLNEEEKLTLVYGMPRKSFLGFRWLYLLNNCIY